MCSPLQPFADSTSNTLVFRLHEHYKCECSVSEPTNISTETIRKVVAINSPKHPNVVGKVQLDFRGDHVEVITIGDYIALSNRWYFEPR